MDMIIIEDIVGIDTDNVRLSEKYVWIDGYRKRRWFGLVPSLTIHGGYKVYYGDRLLTKDEVKKTIDNVENEKDSFMYPYGFSSLFYVDDEEGFRVYQKARARVKVNCGDIYSRIFNTDEEMNEWVNMIIKKTGKNFI